MPIYVIHQSIENGGTPARERRLISAKNQAQAIGFVVEKSIACKIASTDELIECTKAGIEVEQANGAV